MKAEEYLEKGQYPVCRVVGLDGSTLLETGRPSLKKLKQITIEGKGGSIEFSDKFIFKAKSSVIVEHFELWYSDELVGSRVIADVHMGKGVTLEVTWGMTITNAGHSFTIQI